MIVRKGGLEKPPAVLEAVRLCVVVGGTEEDTAELGVSEPCLASGASERERGCEPSCTLAYAALHWCNTPRLDEEVEHSRH